MARLLLLFAVAYNLFSHISTTPLLWGPGPVQMEPDFCSSDSCIPILKCLQENEGKSFCNNLMGSSPLTSSQGAFEQSSPSCVAVDNPVDLADRQSFTTMVIATVVTTIIFTPSPAATVTATVGVQEVALQSYISIVMTTEEHSGFYTEYLASTTTQTSFSTQLHTVYATTTSVSYAYAAETQVVSRYYKRHNQPTSEPIDYRGWPKWLEPYDSRFVSSACQCLISSAATNPAKSISPEPACTRTIISTSTFTRTATMKIASGTPSGTFTVISPITLKSTTMTSVTSTSTVHIGQQGQTTITQPPVIVTEFSSTQSTTILTSTVISTIALPVSTSPIFSPRCDDARFFIQNIAFYPQYEGGYASENVENISSSSQCCSICASQLGCVSWFFDIAPSLNDALVNQFPEGVSIEIANTFLPAGTGSQGTSNGNGAMSSNGGSEVTTGNSAQENSAGNTNALGAGVSVVGGTTGGASLTGSNGAIGSTSLSAGTGAGIDVGHNSGTIGANAGALLGPQIGNQGIDGNGQLQGNSQAGLGSNIGTTTNVGAGGNTNMVVNAELIGLLNTKVGTNLALGGIPGGSLSDLTGLSPSGSNILDSTGKVASSAAGLVKDLLGGPPVSTGTGRSVLDIAGNPIGSATDVANNLLSGNFGLGSVAGLLSSGLIANAGGTAINAAGQILGSVSDLANGLSSSNVIDLNNSALQASLSGSVESSSSTNLASAASVSSNAAGLGSGLTNTIGNAVGNTVSAVGGVGNSIPSLGQGPQSVSSNTLSTASDLTRNAANNIGETTNSAVSGLENVANSDVNTANSAANSVLNNANSGLNSVGTVAGDVAQAVNGATGSLGGALTSAVSNTVNNAAANVGNAVSNVGNTLGAALQGVTSGVAPIGSDLTQAVSNNIVPAVAGNIANNIGSTAAPVVGALTQGAAAVVNNVANPVANTIGNAAGAAGTVAGSVGGISNALGGILGGGLRAKRQTTKRLSALLVERQIAVGTVVSTAVSVSVSVTAIPSGGTTISTVAAVTMSIEPPPSDSQPPAQSTASPSMATVSNSTPMAAPGICVLFFVPSSGNLDFCPAGKVTLQYPSVQIGSNKYGGLGPCARYPGGAPGVPMLDQQYGPIGL